MKEEVKDTWTKDAVVYFNYLQNRPDVDPLKWDPLEILKARFLDFDRILYFRDARYEELRRDRETMSNLKEQTLNVYKDWRRECSDRVTGRSVIITLLGILVLIQTVVITALLFGPRP